MFVSLVVVAATADFHQLILALRGYHRNRIVSNETVHFELSCDDEHFTTRSRIS